MAVPALVLQTVYAELLERSAGAAFSDAFAEAGAFVCKTIKGRRYWYFQAGVGQARKQRYVGPETPELIERIERHQVARNDERERRALVSTLVRSFGLPRAIPQLGDIIDGLAKAGVFRLRGVLVGTVAYQTYSAMLGVKLPHTLLQTGDIDIAQFRDVSIAAGDSLPPMLEILKKVDRSFTDIPSAMDGRHSTSYAAKNGVRVDFLTPARRSGADAPQMLPSLNTEAQPLPFLDYLIHEPEPAVLLHNSGVYVQVPAPQRYAVHKLIVSQRRPEGVAKRQKDLHQAALLEALVAKRPFELKLAWEEALQLGPTWRQLLAEGVGRIGSRVRDLALKAVGGRRSMIPRLDLSFNNSPVHYDFSRDVVTFAGDAAGRPIACAISREALDDHFGADGLGREGRMECFLKNRSKIEPLARTKYLSWPVDEPDAVLVKTMDVPKLVKEDSAYSNVKT
jgi:hypothetical protein